MGKVIILGAGMAGCGAAYHLSNRKIDAEIYEMQSYVGGHAASYIHDDGFIFDDGPHISFTKDKRIQQLFADSVNGEYEVFSANVNNHWKSHWINHPAVCNLHGLPADLITNIINDFVEVQSQDIPINNYEDWLVATYGRTYAEVYPMQYTIKYHTTTAANMDIDWLGPRLYRPNLKEVIQGALDPNVGDVHYIKEFRYPSKGGFASYLNQFRNLYPMNFGHKAIEVDPKEKTILFANGKKIAYDSLVSTIPLPELIKITKGAPEEVKAAAELLSCTTCVLVNLGIDREDISNDHWTYFYDHDYIFTRLSYPYKFSKSTVPEGKSSIQCEIYFSKKYRPMDMTPEECIEPTIKDLIRCGILREDDEIIHKDAGVANYANVIFDLDRADALAIVNGYLDSIGINRGGRFGDWGYMWTDESFKSGERAAEEAISKVLLK